MLKRERERKRDREGEKKRETERDREIKRERKTEREREKEREKERVIVIVRGDRENLLQRWERQGSGRYKHIVLLRYTLVQHTAVPTYRDVPLLYRLNV